MAAVCLLTLASCGGEAWTDPGGNTLTENPGAEHCGWQSATSLEFEGVRYVRDPQHVFSAGKGEVTSDYDSSTETPAEAEFTGYQKGDDELWQSPQVDAVFVRSSDGVELWPRLEAGCD